MTVTAFKSYRMGQKRPWRTSVPTELFNFYGRLGKIPDLNLIPWRYGEIYIIVIKKVVFLAESALIGRNSF